MGTERRDQDVSTVDVVEETGSAGASESSAALGESGFGWRRLQGLGAASVPLVFAYIMISEGFFEPFFLIMGGPFLVGLGLLAMRNRVGVVWLGVVSVAFLAMNGPFALGAWRVPASSSDFITVTLAFVGALIVAIATIPAWRQGKGRDQMRAGARRLGLVTLVLIVALSAMSLMISARFTSPVAQPGDATVVAENFEFEPASISADPGEISIHATNNDSPTHTITIDQLGVDLTVPGGGKSASVTFDASPGTYEFYCRPHPEMMGTLTVS